MTRAPHAGRTPAAAPRTARRAADPPGAPAERRRASRSLWSACESLLAAAEPRA
ncbi:MAG: hypothetical protein HY076_05575, partial [Candidatus Eisenbacteria bacterium]|nr:hypothetical protein [Candidatus Eisenbacteria bacterium]